MSDIAPPRSLRDLVSVGPACLRDLALLGVTSVADLATRDPRELYESLCRITGQRQDPCVADVFQAIVAQARDPELPPEQRQWFYWSRVRKAEAAGRGR